jgi:transcriptional regulator with XRE-family HTH domain
MESISNEQLVILTREQFIDARKKMDLTQKALADLLGITENHVAKIECDRAKLTIKMQMKMYTVARAHRAVKEIHLVRD